MFDQAIPAPKSSGTGSSTGEDVLLHITTIVNITKGDGSEVLEIMCSAWPDSLEIDRLFIRRGEKMPAQPYAGPEFKYGFQVPQYYPILILTMTNSRNKQLFSYDVGDSLHNIVLILILSSCLNY